MYVVQSIYFDQYQLYQVIGIPHALTFPLGNDLNYCRPKEAIIFFGIAGVMNFRKYLGNIFVTPYLVIKSFMNNFS